MTGPRSTDVLDVETHDGGVVLLRLQRPSRRNALSIQLRDDVCDVLDDLVGDVSTAAVVITGAGEVFSAGFDLSEFEQAGEDPDLGTRLWASADRWHETLFTCEVPLVAALNGPALAGGLDLLTACDVRIAQTGVWFQRPETAFTVPLVEPLRELIGGGPARDLTLTGRRMELDEAHRLGLVTEIAAKGGAVARALEVAADIATRPPALVREAKRRHLAAAGVDGWHLRLSDQPG